MITSNFYSISKPAEWAEPPTVFSYSSLQVIKTCPLQWQLLHSKYGTELLKFPTRPFPAAVEGNIIHSVLEKLFRALSLIGLPAIGTYEFSECISRVNIKEKVNAHIFSHEEKITKHPRGNGFKLRLSTQQLVNKIIRLFRQQYSDLPSNLNNLFPNLQDALNNSEIADKNSNPKFLLKKIGALTEFKIEHPTIPFMGIIDFIFLEEGCPVVVDFKTGSQNEDHLKQVEIYAILWWSKTGQLPKRLEVRYPQLVNSIQVDKNKLAKAEQQLCTKIEEAIDELAKKPAKASQGKQCMFCDVRQFCDEFWKQNIFISQPENNQARFVDIAVTVNSIPTNYGFEGKTSNDEKVVFVFSKNTSKLFNHLKNGQNLRVLFALVKGNEIIIKPRTEIYHVNS